MKNASDGYIRHSKAIPLRGAHHRVLDTTARRTFRFGTDELVGTLLRAAARVAREYPHSVLLVGNMSRKGGGDIPVSVSHNSGRDADLPFYAADVRGRSIHKHGFIRFDGRGKGGRFRFDVPRNWAFVRAVLSDTRVQVQWLFMSNPLRALLLEYARAQKEPDWLQARAAAVLGQPGNSSAHAEHFHLRLYCARHERLEGCLNYGTLHPWTDDYSDDVAARGRELVGQLTSVELKTAVAAIETVAAIRAHSVVGAVARALFDPRGPVKLAAVRALRLLRHDKATSAELVRSAAESNDPTWTHELVLTMGLVRDPAVAPGLMRVLADRKLHSRTRAMAATGLGRLLHQPAVPTLFQALVDRSREVRRAARGGLAWLTNHDFGRGKRALRRWKLWWGRHSVDSHLTWVEAGFRKRRLRFTGSRRSHAIRRLVKAVGAGGPRAWNARLMIRKLTGYWVEQGHYSNRQMGRFYRSWLGAGR